MVDKRDCIYLKRDFGSDFVTCLNPDNPTAKGLRVCSPEHCPLIKEANESI